MAGAMFLRRAQAATRSQTLNAMIRRTEDGSVLVVEPATLFPSFKRRREYDVPAASSFRLAPSSTITKRAISSLTGGSGGVDGGVGGSGISDSRRSRRTRFGASAAWFKNRTCSEGAQFSSITSGSRSILKIPSFKVAKVSYSGTVSFLEMKTEELLKATNILPRDLFTLNLTSHQEKAKRQKRRLSVASSDFRRTLSVILPRETPTHSIIMAFGNVRAVAGSKSVYILDAHKLPVKDFAQELAVVFRNCTNDGGFVPAEPCELIFLEEALRETVDTFQRRLRLFEPIVDRFLQRVANEVYSDTGVHQLVPLKDSLRSFQITTQQSLDCLTSLLNDDDSMLGLLLTEQEEAAQSGKPVDFTRHEHVEVLLGVYARQLYNINLEVQYLLGRLQSKQEFVALALASYRNRMVRMNVHISIVGLSMAIGTVMSSFFGMNLINGLESHPNAWYYVVTTSTLTGLFVSMISLNYLSGGTMRKRTAQRLEENETLAGALSDMSALDYTLKATLNRGERLTKDDFRRIWNKAARAHDRMPDQFNDGVVPAKEVDLLFEVFDNVKDGFIGEDDFHSNS